MSLQSWSKRIQVLCAALLISLVGFANEALYKQARALQRERKYDEAIEGFKSYLSQSIDGDDLTEEQLFLYTEALMQLMNTYQSKGEPEACVSALQEVFAASPTLQKQCLRDYYSVLGYALSRTEMTKEAEETEIKAVIRGIFAKVLMTNPEEIGDDDHFMLDLGGSSLDYFGVVGELSEKFGIKFMFEEEDFGYSVSAFEEIVRKHLE